MLNNCFSRHRELSVLNLFYTWLNASRRPQIIFPRDTKWIQTYFDTGCTLIILSTCQRWEIACRDKPILKDLIFMEKNKILYEDMMDHDWYKSFPTVKSTMLQGFCLHNDYDKTLHPAGWRILESFLSKMEKENFTLFQEEKLKTEWVSPPKKERKR